MQCLRNEKKEIRIEAYAERKTAVARKRIEEADTVTKRVQEHMRKAENSGLTSRESEKMCREMLSDIIYSLSKLSYSNDEKDAEDDVDQGSELGKRWEDVQPGRVMGTISKMAQQCMERCRQKQKKLD